MSGPKSPFPPVPPVGHVLKMREADKRFVGVFVEGTDDVQLWNRWLKHRPVDRGGCREVLAAMDELRRGKVRGCVGIVDADLARVRGQLVADPDVIISGSHDHECDLVLSSAFDRLLQSLPSTETELATLSQPSSLRDALRDRALPFGLLRWIFLDLGQPFPDRLTPNNEEDAFIVRQSWTLHREALLDVAASLLSWSRDALDAQLASRQGMISTHDYWSVCHGHDVVALLRLALGAVSDARKILRSEPQVRWALQNSLDSSDLPNFPMWQQLVAWEARNSPFVARK